MVRVSIGLLLLLLVAGCKPQAQKAPTPDAATETALPAAATPTQAGPNLEVEFAEIRARIRPAVNARVPQSLASKLKFEPQFDSHNRVVALVPETWVVGDAPGQLRPPKEDDLGAATSITFGSACDGRCTPKDWQASFDKVEVRTMAMQQIETDEPIGSGGRVVVARAGETYFITAGIWKDEASRYFFCRATLEGKAVEAKSAFLGACRAMDVRRWE